MGGRNRGGEKVAHKKLIATMHENAKRLSRRKAENALRNGADPTTKDSKGKGIYTQHDNYHVRRAAFLKMGMPMPEDSSERTKFLASIHVKEATFAQEKQEELTEALVSPITTE